MGFWREIDVPDGTLCGNRTLLNLLTLFALRSSLFRRYRVGVELNGVVELQGSRTLNAVHKDNNYAMVAEPEVAYKKKTKKGVIRWDSNPLLK